MRSLAIFSAQSLVQSLAPSLVLSLAVMAAGGAALAQQGTPEEGAVAVRQAHMQIFGHNLGILGGMAQENIPYDADAASAAAANLVAMASIDQNTYWLPGTASGETEGSRALPALFENLEDVDAKNEAMLAAATAMSEVAGGGLDGLRGGMGGLGSACGACHELYRESN